MQEKKFHCHIIESTFWFKISAFCLLCSSHDLYMQGLYEWRDAIARAEDESTGYILPNKTLLEIGRNLLEY